MNLNIYKLFGLPSNPTQDDIESSLSVLEFVLKESDQTEACYETQLALAVEKLLVRAKPILLDPESRAYYHRQLLGSQEQEKPMIPAFDVELTSLDRAALALSGEEYRQALEYSSQVLAERPREPIALEIKTRSFMLLGMLDEAIQTCKELLTRCPHSHQYHALLGALFAYNGQMGQSLKAYSSASKLCRLPLYIAAMGEALVSFKDYEQGVQLLEEANEKEPNNAIIQRSLAIGYHNQVISKWEAEGGMPTSRESVSWGQERLLQAKGLLSSEEFTSKINSLLQIVEWSLESHWDRSILGTLWNGFLTLVFSAFVFGLIAESIGGMIGTILGVLLGVVVLGIWYSAGWSEGWRISKFSSACRDARRNNEYG